MNFGIGIFSFAVSTLKKVGLPGRFVIVSSVNG
jgi:hypothetical protein